METSLIMKRIYIDIQEKLYYMIPEKWDSIYLYASIFEGINNIESGEMFFYYFPKGIFRKEPVNVYEIPNKFNIEEKEYFKLTDALYNKIKKLKKEYERFNKKKWTNITISIENYQFKVEYGYEDLKNSEYNSYYRHIIWRYVYLKTGLNTYNKEERKVINSYIQKYKYYPPKRDIYVENLYKNGIHNVINYNKEIKKEEQLKLVNPEQEIKKEKIEKNKNISKNQILKY